MIKCKTIIRNNGDIEREDLCYDASEKKISFLRDFLIKKIHISFNEDFFSETFLVPHNLKYFLFSISISGRFCTIYVEKKDYKILNTIKTFLLKRYNKDLYFFYQTSKEHF